jgi:hypothetical protein
MVNDRQSPISKSNITSGPTSGQVSTKSKIKVGSNRNSSAKPIDKNPKTMAQNFGAMLDHNSNRSIMMGNSGLASKHQIGFKNTIGERN